MKVVKKWDDAVLFLTINILLSCCCTKRTAPKKFCVKAAQYLFYNACGSIFPFLLPFLAYLSILYISWRRRLAAEHGKLREVAKWGWRRKSPLLCFFFLLEEALLDEGAPRVRERVRVRKGTKLLFSLDWAAGFSSLIGDNQLVAREGWWWTNSQWMVHFVGGAAAADGGVLRLIVVVLCLCVRIQRIVLLRRHLTKKKQKQSFFLLCLSLVFL